MTFIKNNKKLIAVLLIIILGYLAYSRFFKSEAEVVEVTKTSPETILVKKTVTASGEVKSSYDNSVAFPLSGNVTNVYVKEGEQVTKGQLLAQIYNYDREKSSEALKNARDAVRIDRDLFVENYETKQESYGGKDEYAIQLKKLDELVDQAEASYQASLGSYYNTYINSPIDGTVLEINKDQGEFTLAGESVFRIADLNNMLFEVELDQEDFGQVRHGMKVEITLDAYEGAVFDGVIDSIPLYTKEDAAGVQSFVIKIKLQNNEETPALLGMDGDASILIAATEKELISLTFDAVFSDGDEYYIWIQEDGLLSKHPVEIGLEGDIYTEIKSSIEGLDIVVPESDNPVEGSKVKVLE